MAMRQCSELEKKLNAVARLPASVSGKARCVKTRGFGEPSNRSFCVALRRWGRLPTVAAGGHFFLKLSDQVARGRSSDASGVVVGSRGASHPPFRGEARA